MMEFQPFPKIARLSRDIVITEKLDGTNAQVCVRPKDNEDGTTNPMKFGFDTQVEYEGASYYVRAGSRNRWLSNGDPKNDNFGFGAWVYQNAHELVKLGPGRHFGEWYGTGIQRGYELDHKRFALFNVNRWAAPSFPLGPKQRHAPDCCEVVPVLYAGGEFHTGTIDWVMGSLREHGSAAVPGFMDPEGIIIYHTAANVMFKKTFDGDGHKGSK